MPDEITHSRPDVFYPKNMPIKIFDDLKKKTQNLNLFRLHFRRLPGPVFECGLIFPNSG